MELRNLKTFQVVAEELNITKAAKRLKYSQPTLTLQIQSLERELNHTLITRVGKRNVLTAAGRRLKVHVDNLFELVEEIETDMAELHRPAGTLTIAASEYYCVRNLASLLKTYTEMHPEVHVSLLPLNSIPAIQSVTQNVADIAIIAGECNDVDIRKDFLEEEQTFLVVSSEISKNKTSQDILTEFPFISYGDDCSFMNVIDQYFIKIGTDPKSTIVCGGSDETIKRAVLNDTGYAILGENIIKEELNDGSITILDRVPEPIITSSITLKARSKEPNIQTFNELLQNSWELIES